MEKLPSVSTNKDLVKMLAWLSVLKKIMGSTILAAALYQSLWYNMATWFLFVSESGLVLDMITQKHFPVQFNRTPTRNAYVPQHIIQRDHFFCPQSSSAKFFGVIRILNGALPLARPNYRFQTNKTNELDNFTLYVPWTSFPPDLIYFPPTFD